MAEQEAEVARLYQSYDKLVAAGDDQSELVRAGALLYQLLPFRVAARPIVAAFGQQRLRLSVLPLPVLLWRWCSRTRCVSRMHCPRSQAKLSEDYKFILEVCVPGKYSQAGKQLAASFVPRFFTRCACSTPRQRRVERGCLPPAG